MRMRRRWAVAAGLAIAGALMTGLYTSVGGGAATTSSRPPVQPGMPLQTGPAVLNEQRERLQAYLTTTPTDIAAAARLAELSLRETRVTGNGSLVVAAELSLRRAMGTRTSYEGERVLAAVVLSQHRFAEAARIATRLSALQPNDVWLRGVIGDAALELGDYEQAFLQFDAMTRLRPDASGYARVAYARELQGDVRGALEAMAMALAATSPHDREAQAWHAVQLAALHHQLGHRSEARLEVERALHTFPNYPPALAERGTILAGYRDLEGAAASLAAALSAAPTASWFAQLGDVEAARGRGAEAERAYASADAAWTTETPEPREHALFLAMHARDLGRALALAQQATRGSRDIVSAEAHAWAAYSSGDLPTARRMIEEALRTGSRLRRLRHHAAAIYARLGDHDRAREHLRTALAAPPAGDLVEAPAVAALARELGLSGAGEAGRLASR